MEFITENFKIVLLAVIALFAGIVIKIRNNKKKEQNNNSNNVTQTGNTVRGDMAGRDIKK